MLRGFYFISGTQEGTPIDRVLGAIARTYQLERAVIAPNQASGRSYFLTRLMGEVIIAENGLAGTNLKWERRRRWLAVGALFLGGGLILYFTAHPFLESLLALAISLGVSQFVFVQWVAPFLSEFPEKVSAFLWARRITRAPVALMNLVSSNINQWSILSGLIPVVYCISHGSLAPLPLDSHQRIEILLTILQSLLGWLLIASMSLTGYEAAVLFVFWLIQFLLPSTREAMIGVYAAWCVLEILLVALGKKSWKAFPAFARVWRRGGPKEGGA
jgi:Ca2+/Na+ antiporter